MPREQEKCYIAIDLKSFYASVECLERGLNPLKARLVVADISRTDKTICLAVSPALKERCGLGGRERLYKVIQAAERAGVDFTVAPPQMHKYMEISQKIFGIYGRFIAPEDIHVYSIDEVFIDATSYLKNYRMTGRELAETMIHAVLDETGITATAGIGTNLYLAKIAMDIKAKRLKADEHGVRIAELNEMSYRQELWSHTPLTDFWRIGHGYARRLSQLGIHTMGELARYSLSGSGKLYKEFGIAAELLIDHAWGYEPVTMADIKNYRTENHSVSSGQVLHEPYGFESARLIAWEMADTLALDLFADGLATDQVVLTVNYDKDNPTYDGPTHRDHYGRVVPKPAHGTLNLDIFTNSSRIFAEKTVELFDKIVNPDLTVRAIYVVAGHVRDASNAKSAPRQADLFTDYIKEAEAASREQKLQEAELLIKKRYGRNAILKLKNYEKDATMRARNNQVGGHKA
ncbi:DNA methylase [Candidatus Saccharibacteria bacterium]|nr:DNA methylase [Candidatus Saccharibacteria bacterium]